MPLPKRRDDLRALGYAFMEKARCRGCKEQIEWAITPNGGKMPFNVNTVAGIEILEPHWATCPNAGQFRRKK